MQQKSAVQTAIYLGTIAVGQLASFVLLPIITRYLVPAAYGDYTLALTLTSLLGVLCSSWIRNVAFRLYFEARQSGSTRGFVLTVATAQLGIVTAIYCVSSVFISSMGLVDISGWLLFAAALFLITGDFYILISNLLRAEQLSVEFAVGDVGSSVIRVIGTIGVLTLGFRSSPDLLFVLCAAQLVAAAYGLSMLSRRLTGPSRFDIQLVRAIGRLGVSSIPLSVGVWVMALSDRFLLEHYTDKTTVGFYSAGYSLGDRLVGGVVAALFMMAWPQVLKAWSESGQEGAVLALRNALTMFLWLTVGPLVFVLVYSAQITHWLTGPGYAAASGVLPWVALSSWLSGLTTYLNRPLELHKRYGIMSTVMMVGAVLNIVVNVILIPQLGATGAAVSTLGAYGVVAVLFLLMCDRSFLRFPFTDAVTTFIVAGVCAVVSKIAFKHDALQAGTFVVGYAAIVATRFLGRRWDLAKC